MNRKKGILTSLAILILIAGILLTGLYRLQIVGYEKLGQIDNWGIYYRGEVCATALEGVYSDGDIEYYLPCISSDFYVITNGLKDYNLREALVEGIITIEDALIYTPVFPITLSD